MLDKRILIPLLNEKTPSFSRGPAWYFDDGVLLDTIYDEDFAAFHRDSNDAYTGPITARTKCIYISDIPSEELAIIAKTYATKIKFVLNNFSIAEPPLLTFAALVNFSEKSRIVEVTSFESPDLEKLKHGTFRLSPGSNREVIRANYTAINKSCTANPTTLFTLERFNSSLLRSEIFDKIVDITISMESLIEGKDELRYKFSLYNSVVSESDPNRRFDAFGLLQSLYDARSAIVHGDVESKDSKKAIDKTKENWPEVVRLAKATINYYLLFLGERTKNDWNLHLKRLVFGLDKRLID